MKRGFLLVTAMVLAVLLTSVASGAPKQTDDQGRRLAGPFCVGKRFLKPLDGSRATLQIRFQLAVLRAGAVRSVAATQPCRPWENRKFGLAIPQVAGPAGAKGDAGAAGPAGPTGATGAAGAIGPKGADGAKGDTGATGATGAVGPAGAQGEQGIQGMIGATGPAGPMGLPGMIGPPGPPGEKGETGATGPAGAKGDTGATGAAGPAGPAGPAGAQGEKGETGATGAVGPAGPAGPAGPTGPAGPAGPKGDTGDIGSLETITGGTATGEKQFTVTCPAGKQAVSGGFNIQGSVTASFRSGPTGNPMGTTSWTIIQSSGAALSGTVYVYCA